MRPYRLAPQVHVCVSNDGAVFLDLEKDAYLGLEPDQAHVLSLVVEAWPESEEGAQHIERTQTAERDARTFAQTLCRRGLLTPTTEPLEQQRPIPPHLSEPESELIPWNQMSARHLRLSHVIRFLRSALTAVLLLRCRPFPAVVDRMRRRKARHAQRPRPFEIETARNLLSAYTHIRPFIYGQKGRCLLDSLTLLEFLEPDGLCPTWVIGVQIHPFGSHSWLQHESFVLNGTPAYVRAYTPILVV
jgi:hypothetical protein